MWLLKVENTLCVKRIKSIGNLRPHARVMHSTAARINGVLGLFSTILMVLATLVAASSFFLRPDSTAVGLNARVSIQDILVYLAHYGTCRANIVGRVVALLALSGERVKSMHL